MNSQSTVLCKIRLQIHKVTLKVRFPCSVTCAIKIQGKETDIAGQGQLKNGEASLNITHSQQIRLPLGKGQSGSDKKYSLLIFLKSTSGKIPAGTVPLSLSANDCYNHREITRIQKCPDKNAVIEYDLKCQKLDDNRRVQDSNEQVLDKGIISMPTRHYQSNLYKAISPERERMNNNPIRSELTNRHFEPNIYKAVSPERERQRQGLNRSSRYMRASQAQISMGSRQTLNLRRVGSRKQLQNRASVLQDYYMSERQRSNEAQKLYNLQRQAQNNKTKLQIYQSQINSKSSKIGDLDKELKQLQKRNQQLQLDLKASFSKAEILEKQNKEMGVQLRNLKEKMDQEKLGFQNALKRVQIREGSSKQQIKVLTDKLYASQNEKQKMIFQKNQSANDFEGREKKIREGFKEKQKKMIEERTVFLKKIDGYQKDIESLQQQINDSKSKYSEALQNLHDMHLILQQLQAEKERFRTENSDLKFQLTKCKNQKYILQQNLESITKFNDERRQFRRQLSEKQIQNTQLKQKLNGLENNFTRGRTSVQEVERTLRERTNQLKILERDYNILIKQNKIIGSEAAEKDSRLVSVLDQLQLQSKRNKMTETKLITLSQALEDERQHNQRLMKEAGERGKALEDEIQKLNQELFGYSQQIASLQKDRQQLQQLLQERNESVQHLQSQLIQLNEVNQQLQLQKLQLGEEKRDILQNYQHKLQKSQQTAKQLTRKMTKNTELFQNKISDLESDAYAIKQKIRQQNLLIKEKQEAITKISTKCTKLENDLEKSSSQKITLTETSQNMRKECQSLRDKAEVLKRDLQDKDVVNSSLRTSISQLEGQFSQLSTNYQSLNGEFNKLSAAHKTLKESFNRYQQTTQELFEQLQVRIGDVDFGGELVHSDEHLAQKANELIYKMIQYTRHQKDLLQEKEDKIKQMQSEMHSVYQQKTSKEENLNYLGKDLELLKKSTTQYSQELTIKNDLIKTLKVDLEHKEQEIDEITQINSKKIALLNSTLASRTKEITELKQKIVQYDLQLEAVKNTEGETNSKYNKIDRQKKSLQNELKNKINQAEANLRTEVERSSQLQADKSSLQKQVRQEKENVRKLMRELQNKCYECEQLQSKYEETDEKARLRQGQSKKGKTQVQQIKQLIDAIVADVEYDGETPINLRFQKALTLVQSKQNESLKLKVHNFYVDFLGLLQKNQAAARQIQSLKNQIANVTSQIDSMQKEKQKAIKESMKLSIQLRNQKKNEQMLNLNQQNQQLLNKLSRFEKELADKQKERVMAKKQYDELKGLLQQSNKAREKENQSKAEMNKFFQEQKNNLQNLKKIMEQLGKLINNFQKQKKVSIFVISPIKQGIKKQQDIIINLLKSIALASSKQKRQLDLALLRSKKPV